MSLGFTPRPSLSDRGKIRARAGIPGVAGVYAPAFVERRKCFDNCKGKHNVSLGFTPRPSLSAFHRAPDHTSAPVVSLGFTPRPSLSGPSFDGQRQGDTGVAGVYAPAFVERPGTVSRNTVLWWCRWGLRPGLR